MLAHRARVNLGGMAMKGILHPPKPQHHWNFTIRLFSVICRTLIKGSYPSGLYIYIYITMICYMWWVMGTWINCWYISIFVYVFTTKLYMKLFLLKNNLSPHQTSLGAACSVVINLDLHTNCHIGRVVNQ